MSEYVNKSLRSRNRNDLAGEYLSCTLWYVTLGAWSPMSPGAALMSSAEPIGVGESIDDLQKFNPEDFVKALFDVKQEDEYSRKRMIGC